VRVERGAGTLSLHLCDACADGAMVKLSVEDAERLGG
jgi:hypothetical protein